MFRLGLERKLRKRMTSGKPRVAMVFEVDFSMSILYADQSIPSDWTFSSTRVFDNAKWREEFFWQTRRGLGGSVVLFSKIRPRNHYSRVGVGRCARPVVLHEARVDVWRHDEWEARVSRTPYRSESRGPFFRRKHPEPVRDVRRPARCGAAILTARAHTTDERIAAARRRILPRSSMSQSPKPWR